MGWYDVIKDCISIAQKADNLQLVKDILDAQQQIFDLVNENNQLKVEIKKLNEVDDISSKIQRHKDAYVTLSGDTEKLVYCSCCWDTKRVLVQGQIINAGEYMCPACNTKAYFDKKAYDEEQHRKIEDMGCINI